MMCGRCDSGAADESDENTTTAKDFETGEDGGRRERCGGVEESRAPDGGWGWLVVLGSFITTMLLPLLGPGFGVIFSRYLIGTGSSSVTIAWIFNTHCFVWNMMGIVVRPLGNEYGWRIIAMAGVVLASVALILSAFTPSPQFLFFSFSLLSVFPLVQAVVWLRVVMAVWGLGVGTTMGLYNLIMIKFMGVDNLAPVFGASSLANAFGFLSVGPLVGVIRDMSGSYTISMWFLSGLVFISFILWLFMPAAQAYDQRREARLKEEENNILG